MKTSATFLLLFSFVATFHLNAQLKVNANQEIFVTNTLSSKYSTNIFESSILGTGYFSLIGNQQTLKVAKNQTIASLYILNANSTSIISNIQINGNLVIEQGTLTLNHFVFLNGNIETRNDSKISGINFINPYQFNYLHTQIVQYNFNTFFDYEESYSIVNISYLNKIIESAFLLNAKLLSFQPVKPPPKTLS